jgi:hypothetical protein
MGVTCASRSKSLFPYHPDPIKATRRGGAEAQSFQAGRLSEDNASNADEFRIKLLLDGEWLMGKMVWEDNLAKIHGWKAIRLYLIFLST